MMTKIIVGVVLALGVSAGGAYLANAKAASGECCFPGSPCCESGEACCLTTTATKTVAAKKSCCGEGAACCEVQAPCCDAAK